MIELSLLRHSFSASVLALLIAGPAAADQLKRLERFKEQTVTITVTAVDDPPVLDPCGQRLDLWVIGDTHEVEN